MKNFALLLIPALLLLAPASAGAATHRHMGCHCKADGHKWPRCMQGVTVVYGDASISKRYRGIKHQHWHYWFHFDTY